MLNGQQIVRSSWISLLLVGSILIGALIGHHWPDAGGALGADVDRTLLALVGLLFFSVRFETITHFRGGVRTLTLILASNYLFVPTIGYVIASTLLASKPLFMAGLMIYFMSPCTDWFLGFTRLARGNVALGTALIPVNMVMQLLLYPAYLHLFTRHVVEVRAGVVGDTLLYWFLAPLVMAVSGHYVLRGLLGNARFARLLDGLDRLTPWVIALLVMEIFVANIPVILEHRAFFVRVLLSVFLFFVCTFVLGEAVSRLGRLRYPEHALLTMNIAARNGPLMLAVTMVALPDQPLIYAALVIGMLVEFPHLTVLQRVLHGQRQRKRTGHSSQSVPQNS
ncbi:arsenic resistance protein [Burkholderia multivorans]|uniref:Sodium:proton symporter n=1 Tax=Burkholderia multivorans TaxID=87883 RepID=A0AB37APK8_9BURK|nr:arsenic resistance protein [Burkholderia multivorans]PRE45440.1 sodium:proton symporter [Burkholderia multivorans]PRE52128.1 sodium:proton symporter [Burkholderia multivorans]